eukprot:evm.model.scf_1.7 EVM.evm.TU.scf_1.7   scf_1:196568-200195(+)
MDADGAAVSFASVPPNVLMACMDALVAADWRAASAARCTCRDFRAAVEQAFSRLRILRLVEAMLPNLELQAPFVRSMLPLCVNLRTVEISGIFWDCANELAPALAHCRNLTCLSMRCCKIWDDGLEELVERFGGMPNLEVLCVASADELTGCGWLDKLPALTDLDISWCRLMNSIQLLGVSGQLRRLIAHGCDVLPMAIYGELHDVEELDVALTDFSDLGLHDLAQNSKCLRRLVLSDRDNANIWSPERWTRAGMEEFRLLRPDVQVDMVEI